MSTVAPFPPLLRGVHNRKLQVRVAADEAAEIERLAIATGTNVSAVARCLIRQALRSLPTPEAR